MSNVSLAAMEVLFQDNILTSNPAIDNEIDGPSAEFRRARMDIYRDAYQLRLIEVLGNDYEVLRKYLGDKAFDAVARAYLAEHPSSFRNVRWFGQLLPKFLKSQLPYAQHPVLGELALFEWTLGLAFDAADADAVGFDEVAAVPAPAWPGMRFTPHASLHVLDLQTSAVAIWKDIDVRASFEVELSRQPVAWAVWRKQRAPFFRSVDNDEAWALKAIFSNASFGELCGGLCEWHAEAEAAARAAGLLRGWIDEGWIAGLRIG